MPKITKKRLPLAQALTSRLLSLEVPLCIIAEVVPSTVNDPHICVCVDESRDRVLVANVMDGFAHTMHKLMAEDEGWEEVKP